jgi:1-acyl-sn-glycerol-3-phosphate acyltransferase
MQKLSAARYRNPYLSGLRTSLFVASLADVAADFGMRRLRLYGRPLSARDRAGWLHDAARTILRRVGTEVIAEGEPPPHGLIVSNHLSYMDVLVYASLHPCLFVSKREVQDWPVLGRLSSMAGTVYVERGRSADHRSAAGMMEQALTARVPVILFPEGTSTDGGRLLPFRSPFFQPAVRTHAEVTASAIGYESSTAAESELAYYGDDTFGPHLLHTFGQMRMRAHVAFSSAGRCYVDRKEAARMTHAEVERLRASVAARFEATDGFGSYGIMRAG